MTDPNFRPRSLADYQKDIRWKDEPLGAFHVPDSQAEKIRPDGSFETLLGDTVIYELSTDDCRQIGALRNALYEKHRDILCHPLPEKSHHVTLHDLSVSPLPCPAQDEALLEKLDTVKAQIQAHQQLVESKLTGLRQLSPPPIRLRPVKVVNMVCKSVVLLLEPATDDDCRALMTMYEDFNSVVRLPYSLTLHVTLAYYKPGFIDHQAAAALTQSFGTLLTSHPLPEIRLEIGQLKYRCFRNMAAYYSYNAFIDSFRCTREEFLARLVFDDLYHQAHALLANGVPAFRVLRDIAGCQLDRSIPQQKKLRRDSIHSLIGTRPYSLSDPYAHAASCTGDMAGVHIHQFLCASIVENLYQRGLLEETAEIYGEEDLIRHCLFDLRWQQI